MNKGYSIITDFGCKNTCPYCIWKQHSLYNKSQNYNTYLKNVRKFIDEIPNNTSKFSISGGGDPLNDFTNFMDFWELVTNSEKKIDIHTSYINYDKFHHNILGNSINRLVFHTNTDILGSQLFDILKFNMRYKLRVNFVVTSNISIAELQYFENIAATHNIQVAYRELVSECDELSPDWFIVDFCKNASNRNNNFRYVDQADYNTYIMPNGKVYNKFNLNGDI